MIVRIAQPEDEDGLVALIWIMHAETGMFALSEEKLRAYLRRAWAKDNAIIGVIGEIGAPVACVCLDIGSMHYTDDLMLSDRYTFVHPDHRGNGYAKVLIGFAKTASDNLRLPLMLGILSPHDLEKKIKLYEGLMGQPIGSAFFYVAKPPESQERAE